MQFSPNVKPVLKMMGIGMASYEQWHCADKDEPVKQLLASLWKGSQYLKVSGSHPPTDSMLDIHTESQSVGDQIE